MPSITLLMLLFASSAIMASGRSMSAPDQLMPFIFSVADGDSNSLSTGGNGPTRFIQVVEQIIKWEKLSRLLLLLRHFIFHFISFRYVSSIKSTEQFIDNIVNRQKDVAEKTKVLAFLNKCFLITHKVIQYEINAVLSSSVTQKKSNYNPSPLTLEELQQAQSKINDLLMGIEKRLATLKTWIPPTMPFLGFF